MPYINVNDAYILDNTGKQVDDAVDYALANSNRNLLDNPFFTIRQMGTGGVTGVGYAVDRWKNTGGANLTQTPRSPYGITFASSSGYQVDQALWACPAEYLAGKTLTISVMTSGGNIAQATGVFTATSSTAAKVAVTSADGNFTVGLYYIQSACAVPYVRITTPSGRFPVNAAILAVKLELGSYSTLANDVSPDYGEELRKCRFYYRRYANPLAGGMSTITGGTAISATAADFTDNEPMYGGNAGTLAYNGTVQVNGVAVTGKTLYSRRDGKISQNTMRFNVSGGLTAYGSALINLGANSYIELSHDL